MRKLFVKWYTVVLKRPDLVRLGRVFWLRVSCLAQRLGRAQDPDGFVKCR